MIVFRPFPGDAFAGVPSKVNRIKGSSLRAEQIAVGAGKKNSYLFGISRYLTPVCVSVIEVMPRFN